MRAGLFASLLRWAYFDRSQRVFEQHMVEVQGCERGHMTNNVNTYLHSLIVAGVIVSSSLR
ncbi:MAG: hypothetical protein P8I99_06045 [Acidimicrobiales bacterium]|nr:hypothetical protein [Acidimicrobiales bacterium]